MYNCLLVALMWVLRSRMSNLLYIRKKSFFKFRVTDFMGEFDRGVDFIDVHKFFEFFGCSGPYNENIIYESLPSIDGFWCLI